MNYNQIIYEMTQLLKEAEQAPSRKEAIACLNKATLLQETAAALKKERWCGGAGGWDNFVERWH
jgi:hypothetical protein